MLKTASQKYQSQYQKQKRSQWIVRLAQLLLTGLGVVYGLWFLFFGSGWWAVQTVKFSGQSLMAEEELRQAAEIYFQQPLFFKARWDNILAIDSQDLANQLLTSFPLLAEVKVKKNFSREVQIKIKDRQPWGVWCYPAAPACLVFDRSGVGFREPNLSAVSAIGLEVEDYQNSQPALGGEIAPLNWFGLLPTLQNLAEQIGLSWSKLIIPTESLRVNLETTEGWQIYLSLSQNLTEQFNTLRFFLIQYPTEKRTAWQYVDLRVPGRVYFK